MTRVIDGEEMLTTVEAAEILGISNVTLNNWVREEKVKSGKTLGGHNLFSRAHIEEIKRQMMGQE